MDKWTKEQGDKGDKGDNKKDKRMDHSTGTKTDLLGGS